MATAQKTAPAVEPQAPQVALPPSPDKAALKAHHAIVRRQTRPWWASLIPDMRGWAAFGFFALGGYLLYMIGQKPALLDSAPFMQFAGMIMTGGVLLVGSYLFGSSKASSDTSAQMVDALKDLAPPQA